MTQPIDRRGSLIRKPRGAFTLIEILIAIVILAIGLLGLGVVFPVVISQQRTAIESLSAEAAVGQIEAQLRANRSMLIDPPENVPAEPEVRNTRWSRVAPARESTSGGIMSPELALYLAESRLAPGDLFYETGSLDGFRFGMEYAPSMGAMGGDGDLSLNWGESGDDPLVIPLAQRLIPYPSEDLRRPQFVWDMAMVRPNADRLNAVVFLRRVSTGLRAPLRLRDEAEPDLGAVTISDVLLGRYGAMPQLPITLDSDGRPVVDGSGEYSPILAMDVNQGATIQAITGRATPDIIVGLDSSFGWPSAEARTEALAVAGQKIALVSNTGAISVHDVLGEEADLLGGATSLRIDPPLPITTPDNVRAWRFILYTVEPPVAIHEVELEVRP